MKEQLNPVFTKKEYEHITILEVEYTRNGKREMVSVGYRDGDHESAKEQLTIYIKKNLSN